MTRITLAPASVASCPDGPAPRAGTSPPRRSRSGPECDRPAYAPYRANDPNSSSIRSSWLYFAMRSVRLARAGLDLPGVRRHRDVGDGRVLRLAAAVADDRREPVPLRQLDRVERLGQRADLVHLHQDAVAAALRRCPSCSRLVLVTNRSSPTSCTLSPSSRGQLLPAVPVVLGQAVLDRADRPLARTASSTGRSSRRTR